MTPSKLGNGAEPQSSGAAEEGHTSLTEAATEDVAAAAESEVEAEGDSLGIGVAGFKAFEGDFNRLFPNEGFLQLFDILFGDVVHVDGSGLLHAVLMEVAIRDFVVL